MTDAGQDLDRARREIVRACLAVADESVRSPTAFHIHYPDELWGRVEKAAFYLIKARDGWAAHIRETFGVGRGGGHGR
jgi:hypothetical protein